MSRKDAEREARQRFILNAARQLFAKQGIEETTMEDIATAVNYTRRTLYAYFKSRDEICLLVFIEDMSARWEAQKKAIAVVKTGHDKLMTWGETFYTFARENPHSMRLQFYWDFRGIDRHRIGKSAFDAFKILNDELADGLREIISLGIKDGSLRPDLQVDLCISQYLYALRSILNRALVRTYSFATFEPDGYVQHFLDLFSRAIRNKGDSHQ